MLHLSRRAWAAVLLGVAGVAALGVAIAGAQGDETPRGTDPLSAEELELAEGLAEGSSPTESDGLGSDDVVLLVERHQEAKAAEEAGLRRADVYVYSYDDDVLIHTLVDLADGEVVRTEELTDEQLPMVDEERERLDEIVAADAEYQQLLATEYRQAAGGDLTDPATQLIVQPIIFRADSNPEAAGSAAAQCGEHRCVQLLLQTADHVVVDLLPIVDLSAGEVVSREGFFS